MKTKVVICRYNEDLSWLSDIKHDFIIYNKGSENMPFDFISCENTGREGESFIRYIVDNYDSIPDRVVFSQGNPFDHCSDFISLCNDDFFFGYLGVSLSCNSDGSPHHPGLPIHEICSKIGLSTLDSYSFFMGGQMAVSKKSIYKRSLDWWNKCYNEYNSNQESPWVFERLWPLIF